jgi:DNA-binding beta-propeller fold protein YncE/mono/diheme cytochrome c family protein
MTKPIPRLAVVLVALAACKSDPKPVSTGGDASAHPSGAPSAVSSPARALKAPTLTGSVIALTAAGDSLIVADEDHKAIRVVPLPRIAIPIDADAGTPNDAGGETDSGAPDSGAADSGAPKQVADSISFTVPGAPAQVLSLGDGRVLVTLRDPGMLFVLKQDPSAGLVESARIPLPADAWGVAITPDEKTAIVTSAWTHQVSAIDLSTNTKRWTLDVAREPRGIAIRADGHSAYISHLVGAQITRIDDLMGSPTAHLVTLPPAPERTPVGENLRASLGYSLALSDDGKRLFAPRHALGALGAWAGAATVDVLLTDKDAPLMEKHARLLPQGGVDSEDNLRGPWMGDAFIQPRAVIYRKSTKTLLVAAEGTDNVVELDALSPTPAIQVVKDYTVGEGYEHQDWRSPMGDYGPPIGADGFATRGAAPAGMALSADEGTLYVYCVGSHDVVAIRLASPKVSRAVAGLMSRPVRVAEEPLSKDAAIGKRFFYSAVDQVTSGKMGCAGCHPEGREDAMVWHETPEEPHFFAGPDDQPKSKEEGGYPRQTPMLAGRLSALGPYGWHGQAKDLNERLREGFHLHHAWELSFSNYGDEINLAIRARYLSAFVREGLVAPPREERALTEEEERGKKLFLGPTECARCHVPGTGYTDQTVYPMPMEPPLGFQKEGNQSFRTPSLKFVGGTPPYFHDGRASTLEELIEKNDDRMGKTKQLSKEERAALVAYLKTL